MCLSCTESLGKKGEGGEGEGGEGEGGEGGIHLVGRYFFSYVIGFDVNNRGVLVFLSR